MRNLSSYVRALWITLTFLLPLLLGAPLAQAQCAFDVNVTPAGPHTLDVGGSTTLTATALSTSFNANGSGFAGQVEAVLVQPDGKVLVGGLFSGYNGVDTPDGIIRLNADGSRDLTFNAGGGGFTSGSVFTLALEPDGQILVGGNFNSYNRTSCPSGLIRLNADGSRDVNFNVGGIGFDFTVYALALEPDGQILVGGNFTTFNSFSSGPDGLIRLNANGRRDFTFNTSTRSDAGFDDVVWALALEPDGQVLVGGRFKKYNGLNCPDALVRLNTDGSRDATFNGSNVGFTNYVLALALAPDGKVLVGGSLFTYNGTNVPAALVRINADGSLDETFNGSNAGFNNAVLDLALEPDGQVLAGGHFTQYNRVNCPVGLVRLNDDGSRDVAFNGSNAGFNFEVRALALEPDGQVLVGGLVSTYNTTKVPDRLTRLNADGSSAHVASPITGVTYTWSNGATGATLEVTEAGSYVATATDPATGCMQVSNTVVVDAAPSNLVVGEVTDIPAGTYNNVTITGAGFGTLQGNITVNGALLVETGGQLASGCFTIGGPGSFTVQAGATLGICSPAGLSNTANTGTVQVTGSRSLSEDAIYRYNGTVEQTTGTGLPTRVRELVVNNAAGVLLTQPLQVRQRVALSSGSLTLNGQALTLLSAADGTALIDNSGGRVLGATGTMQRHIGTNTAGGGYRHYSSPVEGETISTLAAGSYSLNFEGAAAYNNSATPAAVTPFPTVFAYNQDRVLGSLSNYSTFDKGWQAPESGSELLEVGRGYAVQAPGNILVDFTGQFTSGTVVRNGLNRDQNAQGTDAGMGWHLLGNPYPSPIDWSTLNLGNGERGDSDNLVGLNAAVYVVQSASPYTGTYRTYLAQAPNDPNNSPIIPAGQGFFVRTTQADNPGRLTLTNANRVTTFGVTQPSFGRGSADQRPVLRLSVGNATGTDEVTVYADAKATAGLDAAYDATKLSNPSGLNLSAVSATGETLAIDGRAAFVVGTAIALRLSVPTAGTYTLNAKSVANLPAGLVAYLHDTATGQQVSLSAQPTTTVSLAAGLNTRYSVVFAATNALASTPAMTTAQVTLYPNPASRASFVQVVLPVTGGTRQVQATVLNTLGQVVVTSSLTVQAGQATGTISTKGLVRGIYSVRLLSGEHTVTKQLVID